MLKFVEQAPGHLDIVNEGSNILKNKQFFAKLKVHFKSRLCMWVTSICANNCSQYLVRERLPMLINVEIVLTLHRSTVLDQETP